MVKSNEPGTAMNSFDSSDDESSQEYDTSPLDIGWLDLSEYGCTEKLGITGLPGCRFKDRWRNLNSDVEFLKSEDVKEVFTLCTKGELKKYRTPTLFTKIGASGMNVHHYPFPDGQTPSIATMMKLIDDIRVNLMQGRRSLIHCYGGLGRSCLVAVCLMMLLNADQAPDEIIQKVKQIRGPGAVQSVKQFNFINEFQDSKTKFEKEREETARSVSR